MRKSIVAAVSSIAIIAASFLPTAQAAEGVQPAGDPASVSALAGVHGTVFVGNKKKVPANLKGAPLPDLAARMAKHKKDIKNEISFEEKLAAAERSGVHAPDISTFQLKAFRSVQAALQGKSSGKVSAKASVGSASPHYFGPYGNYANSPQHLPTALVEFAAPPAGAGNHTAQGTAVVSDAGVITDVTITDPGSGYLDPPSVTFTSLPGTDGAGAAGTAILSNTLDSLVLTDPGSGYNSPVSVNFSGGGLAPGGRQGAATATIDVDGVITSLTITDYGTGYTEAPLITITDEVNDYVAATAEASISNAVASVTIDNGGANYVLPGLRKFVDGLPVLGSVGADGTNPVTKNNLEQYIPVGVPDTTTYPGSDYYEIGLVQYREQMHSDLPLQGTLLRGYVQLSTDVVPGKSVALQQANLDGSTSPVLDKDGNQVYGLDYPHYLGPVISSTKDRPVRIKFYNLLPTGVAGDLFLPTDTTVMGAGPGPDITPTEANNWGMGPDPQNPVCGTSPKPVTCFTENRATLHLHGGATPWISDGTPHQWITPANETTNYPQGVSVKMVPDMPQPGVHDGAQTFFYTNQQSARLMFYHDHAWGITRLNVYAGEAAGYLITDDTEKALIANGTIPADQIPLIIEDKTFVPSQAELSISDPTWDLAKWGGRGNLWLPHVYMPAQNPYDVSGANQFGRWAFGPWFWPPTMNLDFMPIQNPYQATPGPCDPTALGAICDPPTYTTIPATPNESMGMEAFNDTPVVNGTAYPTVTIDPKSYRFRILNAANDRFWNLSLYEASGPGCVQGASAGCTEVALNPNEVALAKDDPTVFPTPIAAKGPNWIMIGTESGFIPAPTVIEPQPITWVTDATVFNAGNINTHALLLGPAERADLVVDFSKYAGRTLILYNDAPAAFPARVPSYDYYTDNADLRDVGGAYTTPVGYGPNTRTVMQVVVGPIGRCQRVQHDQAQQGVRVDHPRWRRRLRAEPAPDRRRPGGLQLRIRHDLRLEPGHEPELARRLRPHHGRQRDVQHPSRGVEQQRGRDAHLQHAVQGHP